MLYIYKSNHTDTVTISILCWQHSSPSSLFNKGRSPFPTPRVTSRRRRSWWSKCCSMTPQMHGCMYPVFSSAVTKHDILVPVCLWPSFSQTYKTWKGKLFVSTLSKLLVAAWIKCLLSPLGTKTSARSFNDKPSKITKPSPLTSKRVRSEAVIEPPYLQPPQKKLQIFAEHGAEVMKRTNLCFLWLEPAPGPWSILQPSHWQATVWHLWTSSCDPFSSS